ncbi:hypothetical protein N9U05_00415 [bacterium]|jgi:hypothetical protein|nr:hypothetical protein [bacterium]
MCLGFVSHSRHRWTRKACIAVQIVYLAVQLALVFVLPAFFYLTIYYVLVVRVVHHQNELFGVYEDAETADFFKKAVEIICDAIDKVFILSIIFQLLAGLGNKPSEMHTLYRVCSVYYALLMIMTSVTVVFLVIEGTTTYNDALFGDPTTLGLFIGGSVAAPFVAATFHCEAHHMVATIVQYVAMLPTTVITLSLYAFCNVNGTEFLVCLEILLSKICPLLANLSIFG